MTQLRLKSITITAAFLLTTFIAHGFTIHITGDGGKLGERAANPTGQIDGHDVLIGAAGNTVFTDEQTFSGDRALKLTINEGSQGFGTLGGILNFENYKHVGGKKLVKGDEVWVRVRLWFPEGFEFNRNGRNKFLRLRAYHDEDGKKVSEGYDDLYINGHPEQKNFRPFGFIFEGQARWHMMGDIDHFFTFGEWKTVEYYLKLDNVEAADGGAARVRVWVDGELIADIDDRRTLNREDSFIESMNFFTYWDNDGAHKTQSFYADDLTITSDKPKNVDKHGNPFIGVEAPQEEDQAEAEAESTLPSGPGLAAKYAGDAAIAQDPAVIFTDDFEAGTLEEIRDRWGFGRYLEAMALTPDVPAGSAGSRSLRMTASRSQEGVELRKIFIGENEGWKTIFFRFNVKFAADYPANHHFVSLSGSEKPSRIPRGGAGNLAKDRFSITLEPPFFTSSWHFYAYWPEMRSWQTETGKSAGDPNPYYGNNLKPEKAVNSPRDEWMSVEMMVKVNTDPSDPDNRDGELAFWIDGELLAHFAPGKPEMGHWRRDSWRYDPLANWMKKDLGLKEGPFEGFRFRDKGMENVLINVLRLQNYVSAGTFDRVAKRVKDDANTPINTNEATVYFDNVVMATEYIGPLTTDEE